MGQCAYVQQTVSWKAKRKGERGVRVLDLITRHKDTRTGTECGQSQQLGALFNNHILSKTGHISDGHFSMNQMDAHPNISNVISETNKNENETEQTSKLFSSKH